MRPAKLIGFVAFAFIAAAIFVRLGFWQLSRLHQRRARNAIVLARLRAPQVDVSALPADTAEGRFRRVTVHGTPDYAHQIIWAARSYRGSPGVNFLTPVRVAGTDTAVLVDRGWVYSPDGATTDENRWREPDTAFVGYAEEFPSVKGSSYTGKPRIIARLSYDIAAAALPYPIRPVYVVELGDSVIAPDRIARIGVPPMDEGPHFDYAVQWFAFALVAVAGAGVVVAQSRGAGHASYEVPPPPAR